MSRWIRYSDDELAWIEAHKQLTRRQLQAAFCRRFGRGDVTVDNIKALCERNGWKTGRDGRFPPGTVPPNKGKKMPFNAASARTQFKPGQRSRNTKYVGHERIGRDGYVWMSVAETNPHTGFERRYVQKHRRLWEEKNGPVPEGMCLKSLDGDRANTDPDNWVAIPRAMLPRLNGRSGRNYDDAPAELKPTIMAVAKLEHRARRIREGDE